MKKKLAALVGVLAVSTTVGLGLSQSDQASASENQKQQPTLSMDDVTSLIKEQYEGEITEMELDKENNKLQYEVEVIHENKEYDLDIDAETGKVLKENVEKFQLDNTTEDNNENTSDLHTADLIGGEKAKSIALEQFSGTVVGFEVDKEDGQYVYEIEIKEGNKEADFEVDAVSGDILEMDVETEDDND